MVFPDRLKRYWPQYLEYSVPHNLEMNFMWSSIFFLLSYVEEMCLINQHGIKKTYTEYCLRDLLFCFRLFRNSIIFFWFTWNWSIFTSRISFSLVISVMNSEISDNTLSWSSSDGLIFESILDSRGGAGLSMRKQNPNHVPQALRT